MRVQKSVYYMTDRELRIYKRQLRRRRQLQRRIVTMLATICVIAFCAVSYHGIRSLASSGEDQLKFKYYTQVTVAYGETLWDLSDDYIDYDEYKNKKATTTYINKNLPFFFLSPSFLLFTLLFIFF